MTALPCISASADDLAKTLGEEAALQDWIERRASQLCAEYRQDCGYIHEAMGDLSLRPLAKMQDILILIRDGKDDAELGRLVRIATLEEVDATAWVHAEKEIDA